MEFAAAILIAALVFGVCFIVDKGFSKIFRGQPQHRSGLSVRLNKRYGSFGIISFVLGVGGIFMGMSNSVFLLVSGILLVLLGIGLIAYYMSFGIFYDEDSFILTTFGKKSGLYHYRDIMEQQLYIAYGNPVIELHMKDGRTVQLHGAMTGAYEFLDHAFAGWLQQKHKRVEDCPFYDPENSCWFPPVEE